MRTIVTCAIIAGLLAAAGAAHAQPATNLKDGIPEDSIARALPNNGDPGSARKRLSEYGFAYSLIYTGDALANVSGGLRRGLIYQGKLEAQLTFDLEKLAGWQGWTLYSNSFQIHNTGRIRRDYVGGVNTIAAIEAVPATRLSELWLEKKLLDGAASFRVGQLAADSEFYFASSSTLFLNSDWPTIAALNLPSGGAAYPLATPGVRFKYEPTTNLALLLAVLNGDPAGPGGGDEQLRNPYGGNFRVGDAPFVIGELQYRYNHEKASRALAGTVKLGAWAHTGGFNDQRFDADRLPLNSPASSGVPGRRSGNSGVYGVIDQQVYRPPGADAETGVFLFGRASASPSDRNPIDVYVDGGIVFAGMIPGRPKDSFGATALFARYSNGIRGFDRDFAALVDPLHPIRDYEANIEFTYRAEIVPGWTVQPDVQYVWHPNGQPGRHATVLGLRSMIKY